MDQRGRRAPGRAREAAQGGRVQGSHAGGVRPQVVAERQHARVRRQRQPTAHLGPQPRGLGVPLDGASRRRQGDFRYTTFLEHEFLRLPIYPVYLNHSIPEDDIIIEINGEILWRASEDGFPDTQQGPEWVTEILNKVVGTEEVTDDGVVIEPGNEEVIN